MGLFKSLVDKMRDARKDLEKRAAKAALEQGAKAAKSALDSAGDAIEKAIFGVDDDGKRDERKSNAPPDPFAKLKADEVAKKERARDDKRRAKERIADDAKLDDDVDAELAELKKKLGK